VGNDADDELARTATAPAGASAPAAPSVPADSTLGRYRIQRELGSGGMGVVHAAFDPDLERRVALKVLRSDDGGGEARQRLLREARAMARLAHPNVVTVHEVGSAGGRDYVAMELVDGETLAEWLRSQTRSADDIIAAFAAAARGLAAAHAAGIVHRDFKPHNVLRNRAGRIVVTDFGLARDAHDPASPDPLAITMASTPRAKATAPLSGSSPLSGLTATGSVLGTPAYMAPEQWSGGNVTPATDQFAYCVALWEALAGERPFRGLTIEQLRDEVQRGPAALDASRIPRRLRSALRRGLDPDPKQRWPSMEALLGAMSKAQRRPVVALVIGSAAVVVAAIVYAGVAGGGGASTPAAAPLPGCPPPSIDPASVAVRPPRDPDDGRGTEAAVIHADLLKWRVARDRACGMDPSARQPTLGCLDGVLARLDVVASAVNELAKAPPIDAGDYLIDPAVCAVDRLPSLTTTISREFREVIARTMLEEATPGPTDERVATALLERVKSEPCAAAWAQLLAADAATVPGDRDRHLAAAEQDAERCRDDRVRAEVALAGARYALKSGFLGTTISAKVQLASAAIERVPQQDLTAAIDVLRLATALRANNLDEAIQRGEAAMAGYAARGRIAAQISTGLTTLDLREMRSKPEDLVRLQTSPREWRALAAKQLGLHPIVAKIEGEIAARAFMSGDLEGAYEQLERLHEPVPQARARRIRGRVVDARGTPVAGARVAAGPSLVGGSVAAAIAMPWQSARMRITHTDQTGAFELADGPEDGLVIAQLGNRRSMPVTIADTVTLALEPTGRIEGRVDLRGEPPTRVIIAAQDLRLPRSTRYEMIAPVRADGSFALDGVPRGKVHVFVALRAGGSRTLASVTVDTTRRPIVGNVQLALSNQKRIVHVIVRSTVGVPVTNAQVFVFPGQRKSTTADKLDLASATASIGFARQIEGEKAPPSVVGQARPGDLFATMPDVTDGTASACAVSLPSDLADPALDRTIRANLSKLEIRCVPIAPKAETAIVEVPPWPRFD
jgi:predicted Ser/Thr protein kinase